MNFAIYWMTGVRKPEVKPAEMQALSDLFEVVRSAAVTADQQVQGAVAVTLASNQGNATDAFNAHATGSDSAKAQLLRIADAASATRDAHKAAGTLIESTVTSMDAVATIAAQDVIKAQALPFGLGAPLVKQIIAKAKADLTKINAAAGQAAVGIYAGLVLPDPMNLSQDDTRGSIPQEIADAWAEMTPAERQEFYEAVAEDVTSDWPPDKERPDVIFYSNAEPLPPGAVRPPDPNDDWSGNYGVATDGKIYINYDIMASDDTPVQLHTVVHEIQHVNQAHLRDQYDAMVAADPDVIDDIRAGRRPDPFIAEGTTVDEVERWKTRYEGGGSPYYTHQPVEIDARRSGTEYVDSLTPEQIEELLE